MDAVLSYHMNGLTCGVAKFNRRLARQLGVPIVQLFEGEAEGFAEPLLSIKISEFVALDMDRLSRLLERAPWSHGYRLFLHHYTGNELEERLLADAIEVYCGNSELAAQLSGLRADVQALWCPGTLEDVRQFNGGANAIKVFTFGMAHKIRARHYHRLKQLLDATGLEYGLYLSTALHENTSFDEEFSLAFDQLRGIFDERVYFLGYLSDGAIYNYLRDTTFFAAFFDHGVRANNTSVNLAMQCGSVVITNLDEHSPGSLVPWHNIIDINNCESLPTDPSVLETIGKNAELIIRDQYGWEALERRLRARTSASDPATTAARSIQE